VALIDVWLPEVEEEYFALLALNRDVAADVGNQFRSFKRIVERGLDAAWRPIARAGRAQVYVMYGRYALMFLAIAGAEIAVVKWTVIGTEYEQQLARDEALQRAGVQFR
jgi:hypothetical protein